MQLCSNFPSFLNTPSQRCYQCCWQAQHWPVAGLSSTDSVEHGRNFWQLLTEVTPVAPLLPEPCQGSRTMLHPFFGFHTLPDSFSDFNPGCPGWRREVGKSLLRAHTGLSCRFLLNTTTATPVSWDNFPRHLILFVYEGKPTVTKC